MRKKIIEKFVEYKVEPGPIEAFPLTHTGKLLIVREQGKEWGKIEVDNKLLRQRADHHLVVTSLWSKPPYDAHISAFSRDEVLKLPKSFDKEYNGREFEFKLSDSVRIVDPDGWDEVYECAFEPVECRLLQQLRMQLGLTPLMYGKHELHLTLGIRYEKDREGENGRDKKKRRG